MVRNVAYESQHICFKGEQERGTIAILCQSPKYIRAQLIGLHEFPLQKLNNNNFQHFFFVQIITISHASYTCGQHFAQKLALFIYPHSRQLPQQLYELI